MPKHTSFLKRLNAIKKALAQQRDKLRDLTSEAKELEGNCDEAIDDLERAAQTLSELV